MDLVTDFDQQVRDGLVSHPSRGLGNHADVRFRLDAPGQNTTFQDAWNRAG